jgi:hypothetical protein
MPLRRHQSPNTNSMFCWRMSRNSGVSVSLPLDMRLRPVRIAIYCLPPASNVMGGALNPEPFELLQIDPPLAAGRFIRKIEQDAGHSTRQRHAGHLFALGIGELKFCAEGLDKLQSGLGDIQQKEPEVASLDDKQETVFDRDSCCDAPCTTEQSPSSDRPSRSAAALRSSRR